MTGGFGSVRGTHDQEKKNALSTEADKAFPQDDLESSWGETRTPDPGIMSAVL